GPRAVSAAGLLRRDPPARGSHRDGPRVRRRPSPAGPVVLTGGPARPGPGTARPSVADETAVRRSAHTQGQRPERAGPRILGGQLAAPRRKAVERAAPGS